MPKPSFSIRLFHADEGFDFDQVETLGPVGFVRALMSTPRRCVGGGGSVTPYEPGFGSQLGLQVGPHYLIYDRIMRRYGFCRRGSLRALLYTKGAYCNVFRRRAVPASA